LAERGTTASAGVAAWKADESPSDLLRRADEALYAAKGTGGDSVVAHD
jgi:PleD family two-component response regulator